MSTKYLPTGNEYISIPELNQENGCIDSISFLSMKRKGMLLVTGTNHNPFLKPFVEGIPSEIQFSEVSLENYWIPTLTGQFPGGRIQMTILTPIKEKGFMIRLTVTAESNLQVTCGLKLTFGNVIHCINESKPLRGESYCYRSPWNDNLIFDFDCGGPEFSFAPMTDFPCQADYEEKEVSLRDQRIQKEYQRKVIETRLSTDLSLAPGQSESLTFFFGLGYEEVSAATSAKELLRQGYETELNKTSLWLKQKLSDFSNPKLTQIYNQNLFFCIFYSTGLTYDTEERVLMTSRSPRYYVSAAYWDRDSMLWSFPAILDVDTDLAKEALCHVFTRQTQNIGVHSRYIDGSILEPGFELDELVAPVIALYNYVHKSKDTAFLNESFVIKALDLIVKNLEERKDAATGLYSTFLQPTDDEINYPYLCYDNVLVWKALLFLAELYPDKYLDFTERAVSLKKEILSSFTFQNQEGKDYFGWSIDLKGNHDVYDEPPGSLQLLPYYGFCEANDPTWLTTLHMIRSKDYAYSFHDSPIAEIGCPHAPYPWILSLCNSLLCGYKAKALAELEIMEMDNGIACESVDPVEGKSMTGEAFATCAGFLCHCMLVSKTDI